MDVIGLAGMALTWILTELMKKNPSLKSHTPLVVTIMSAVIGALQAALHASSATAGTVTGPMPVHEDPVAMTMQYAAQNAGGSVLLNNFLRKWIGEYVVGTLLKKLHI